VRGIIEISDAVEKAAPAKLSKQLTKPQRLAAIDKLEKEMREASKMLEFEYAALLRDRIIELRGEK
ncbi:MAG: UvrB/UvrC motif-containing protein, partial [Oscillospiraceae bacterium]